MARFLKAPAVLLATTALLAFAGTSVSAQTADRYKDISNALVAQGSEILGSDASAAKAGEAQVFFERALVANPANVAALIALGEAHEAQDHTSKGLKYYRKALELEPNNLEALQQQTLAFLKRDLVDEAGGNREKIARLCRTGCDALTKVEAAIATYQASGLQAGAAQEAHAADG